MGLFTGRKKREEQRRQAALSQTGQSATQPIPKSPEPRPPEPRLDSKDCGAVLKAVAASEDQLVLARRLSERRLRQSEEERVAGAIIERLRDPAALKYAVLRCPDGAVTACLDRLEERGLCGGYFWERALAAPCESVALRAVAALDEERLCGALRQSGRMNPDCKAAAFERIQDAELLKQLAADCDDKRIATRAAFASGDEKKMRSALSKLNSDYGCWSALRDAREPEALSRLAAGEPDPMRLLAIATRLRELDADAARRAESDSVGARAADKQGWLSAYLARAGASRQSAKDFGLAGAMTAETVERLEAELSRGVAAAGTVLARLYQSEELNPALAGRAEAERRRISLGHSDGRVESSVCGELWRHEDVVLGESIAPR